MTMIFVDTHYFIATFQDTDQSHARAIQLQRQYRNAEFVTTDSVLVEVMNYFSGYGPATKFRISLAADDILTDMRFRVLEQTRLTLLKGIDLYRSRLDKGYSLTDCISMNVCRELGIKQVLTHDRNFEQEGFEILL